MSYPDIADLERVNAEVNALSYVADGNRYGLPEFWARIDKEGGDCEDFALGKLNKLLDLDWPITALCLACCYTETAEYHAVLEVTLADGSVLVLDNRQHQPQTLEALQRVGYKPDSIQCVGGNRVWREWKWTS